MSTGQVAPGFSVTYNPFVPILDQHAFDFLSRSAEQTRRIGARLGQLLTSGDLLCLEGELGSGKTTLVQGMAQGWGSLDGVTSPTFVIVNEYRRPDGGIVFHLDAYRIETEREAAELDVDRLLAEGSLIVEWPERIRAVLPADELRIVMEHVAEEQRHMHFYASGGRYDTMLQELQHMMFGVA